MKLLLLAPGRSIHTHKWAMYFKQKGWEVKVATFQDHYSEENANEIDTVILPKKLPGKLSYFGAVPFIKKLLRTFQPDIFHAHFLSSYGLIGALTDFHPYYVSVWGTDIFQFPQKNSLNRKMIEFTLNRADRICSTSHVMGKETNKYTNKEISITPFGVDLDVFKPMAKAEKANIQIGIVKALSDKYGIGTLIKAFKKVHEKHHNTELVIVGGGPQLDDYKKLSADLSISEHVKFAGRIPNTKVPEFINEMDIFTVPSRDQESFGVAAVEAMACGVPVVVTNVGGLPEVVMEGETGFIVPKEDPEKLAAAINQLIENKEERIRMGQSGVVHVRKEYDWYENASRMEKLYQQTLRQSQSV
ncbi:glycosyltransferase [Fictibacillus sp. b24]|uniref:glycosyltransferase n=1 Tax=Fictibacillus sp. b24 TaxID=3055863 RepID=UPI0025A274D8|nr:glycosyltransferase [Fictibacillus sp. b24]MDM5315059.1 glycosyltransferase [Fictibacillus sp. b24]